MNRNSPRPPMEDPLNLLGKLLVKIYSWWVGLIYPFAARGRNLSFHFTSIVSRGRAPRISLGHSVSLRDHVWLNPADSDPTGEPLIIIEDNTSIGSSSILSARNKIHIERDVLIAQCVLIQDHNHEYEDPTSPISFQGITEGGRIRIGEGSWIGHGAAIICTKGELTIGRNSVVGANSVVVRSIPPHSVVFGVPARVVRQFDPKKQIWVVGSSQDAAMDKHAAVV